MSGLDLDVLFSPPVPIPTVVRCSIPRRTKPLKRINRLIADICEEHGLVYRAAGNDVQMGRACWSIAPSVVPQAERYADASGIWAAAMHIRATDRSEWSTTSYRDGRCTTTTRMMRSSPTKSSGLVVYSGSFVAAATDAIMRSAIRRLGVRPRA